MAQTGELIRLVNYVDDILTTLRRIRASIPGMDAEEKKHLADHMRQAIDAFNSVLSLVEKGEK
jgi:hypothetical protein